MPDGGDLVIDAGRRDESAVLCVSDTGVGLSAEARAHLFEPFFTTKERGRGTGLGLAAVYGTVQAHGGTIDARSAPGGGTCVEIVMPTCPPPEGGPLPSDISAPRPSRPGRVLVIDDEPLVARTAVLALEGAGHAARALTSPREAIEVFRREHAQIDVVVLDMVMPEMTVEEAFDALRDIDPKVAVLLISGFTREARAEEMLERGARRFLQKPFRAHEIVDEVNATLVDVARERGARGPRPEA